MADVYAGYWADALIGSNSKLLKSTRFFVYTDAELTTPATTYTDRTKAVTQPTLVTDSAGWGYIYADPGAYWVFIDGSMPPRRIEIVPDNADIADDANVLLRLNNLSDVASAGVARTNLGLGSAATHSATDFMQGAANLSDLNNVTTARTNLGLGSAATQAASGFVSISNVVVDASGNVAIPKTLVVGPNSPQSSYLTLLQAAIGDNLVALRVEQNDTSNTNDAAKIVNNVASYALKIDHLGSTPHDAVNIVATASGAYTALGINSGNTSLSTIKVVNSGAQTGGQIIAASGGNSARTAALFGADNYGSGAGYLATTEAGAVGSAFQAVYDSGGGFSSRSIYVSGNHVGGSIGYIENQGNQAAGSLLQLAQLNASSVAPLLLLSPAATGSPTADQIAGSNIRVDKSGFIATRQMFNYSGFNNSRIQLSTTGTTIDRNIADTNPVLIVSNVNASASGDCIQVLGAGAALATRFSKSGRFYTRVTNSPTDSDIATSEVGMWFDNTAGAPKVTFRGKDSAGTAFTGTVPLGTTPADTTSTQTLTNKRITRRVVTVTQSATPTINTDNTDVASITGLAQAITSMTTNLSGTPVDGDMLLIRITDNGTARAISWGASFEASTIALPTTTVISTMLIVGFIWNSATSRWRCVAVS